MKLYRVARMAVLATLGVAIGWGVTTTFFIDTPFWIDEWRVIYNLKTRTVAALWGPLDYLQQFPRTYLSVVKVFTAAFDYSAWSLRLPSLLVTSGAIVLLWRLMQRLFPEESWLRFLFVAIVVSSPAFTKYFVQVKQYSMDTALAILAVWQALEVLRLLRGARLQAERYALLCVTFLAAPFCSYTYPIAVAPVMVLAGIAMCRRASARIVASGRVVLPLLLGATAIAVAYWVDVRQLLADGGMRNYWQGKLAGSGSAEQQLFTLYWVAAQVGAGDFFNVVFGVLGMLAFGWAVVQAVRGFRRSELDVQAWMRGYCLVLMALAWSLFLAGKLPLGEARLNAFLTPAIAWMLVDFLRALHRKAAGQKPVLVVGALLYIGVLGNIFTTIAAVYTDALWPKKRRIYATVGEAIRTANERGLPILATPGIAFPEEHHDNLPFDEKMPGDWPLKTHPAYHFADSIRVYRLPRVEDAASTLQALPDTAAVVCDGTSFSIVTR